MNWVSVVPGFGQMHINQQKTLSKQLDKTFLEPLGEEVFFFESPKAPGTAKEMCHMHVQDN